MEKSSEIQKIQETSNRGNGIVVPAARRRKEGKGQRKFLVGRLLYWALSRSDYVIRPDHPIQICVGSYLEIDLIGWIGYDSTAASRQGNGAGFDFWIHSETQRSLNVNMENSSNSQIWSLNNTSLAHVTRQH
jgi:hypothetical protein